MNAATSVTILLTGAIAVAAVMQWWVSRRLAAIEENRERIRLALRFTRDAGHSYRLSIRVANLSTFGVFIERIAIGVVATFKYPSSDFDGDKPITGGFTIPWADVLGASVRSSRDIHDKMLEVVEHRNAEMVLKLEATAVYLDNANNRQTLVEPTTVEIAQQRLVEIPE